MMSVGGLAAGMAHEINNPLGGILQGIQNIKRRLSPELSSNIKIAEHCGISLADIIKYMELRKIPKTLDGIQTSGERAAKIVHNMLNFSRGSSVAPTNCNLNELLDSILEIVANDFDMKKNYDFKSLKIKKNYDPKAAHAVCIPNEMEQVFLNIFKNAAQAMADKDYGQTQPGISLTTKVYSKDVTIEIEDNGPGIEQKIRKQIFDPFFSTKQPGIGTGLGLSVSYFIITENHGGTLKVLSQPGEWTRFVITLPLPAAKMDKA